MNDVDIDRAAEAIHGVIRTNPSPWAELPQQWRGIYLDAARAALSVLPDPTADTVLLDQVRQLSAEWDDRGATWCMNRIAALLAEADQ